LQQQLRKRAERQAVDRLREAAPGTVSTGTQETLDCLRDGRVLALVAATAIVRAASIAGNAGTYLS